MIVTIEWDLVPWKALNAHAKGNWRAKAAATKSFRRTVGLICTRFDRFEVVEIRLHFFMPDAINRDALNMAQSMKPAIDALVERGIIAEDNWKKLRVGPMHVAVDRTNPRVEIHLSRV
jgi:hypothetical protein